MANKLEKTVQDMVTQIAQYVNDVATVNVDTSYIQVGTNGQTDFAQARPGLRTIIRLDGDSETILPVSPGEGGQLEINTELYEIHQRNVQTAIEYRARILSALLDGVRSYTS